MGLTPEAVILFSPLPQRGEGQGVGANVSNNKSMTPTLPDDIHAAAERARVLRDELQKHNIAYYIHDAPTVSDAELLSRPAQ